MPPKHPGSAELVERARKRATAPEGGAFTDTTALCGLLADRLEALEGALEAGAETKAAYIGEFSFDINDWSDDGEERPRRVVSVPWTTIKEIMAAIKARAALGAGRG